MARDYEQVRRILVAAFDSNDFDSFELKLELLPGEQLPVADSRRSGPIFRWSKVGVPKILDGVAVWTVALDLMSSTNRRRGQLMVHRLYSPRNLQIDINLLTTAFPTALAEALDRTLAHSAQVIPLPEKDSSLIAAQAG